MFFIIIVSIIIFAGFLFLCKKYNFSIVPPEMQPPLPKKFKMPKLKRGKHGKWFVDKT